MSISSFYGSTRVGSSCGCHCPLASKPEILYKEYFDRMPFLMAVSCVLIEFQTMFVCSVCLLFVCSEVGKDYYNAAAYLDIVYGVHVTYAVDVALNFD